MLHTGVYVVLYATLSILIISVVVTHYQRNAKRRHTDIVIDFTNDSLRYATHHVHYAFLNEPFVDTSTTAIEDILINDLDVNGPQGVPNERITLLDELRRQRVHSNEWSIIPLLVHIDRHLGIEASELPKSADWILVGTSMTRINRRVLGELLLKEMSVEGDGLEKTEKYQIIGVGITQSKYTFHYGGTIKGLKFPLITSGFLISRSLVAALAKKLHIFEPHLTIDPPYETMHYITREFGVSLTDSPMMCVSQNDKRSLETDYDDLDPQPSCATWTDTRTNELFKAPFPISLAQVPWSQRKASNPSTKFLDALPFDPYDVLVLVKSSEKFLDSRIKTQYDLWANTKDLPPSMRVFRLGDSDTHLPVQGGAIAMIDVGAGNQEHGHCAKLLAMLNYTHKYYKAAKFVVVIDDDTQVNAKGLLNAIASTYLRPEDTLTVRQRFIRSASVSSDDSINQLEKIEFDSFFRSEFTHRVSPLIMGVRQGHSQYGALNSETNYEFEFPSHGGGVVLDAKALGAIVSCKSCQCASPYDPDDKRLGLWAKHLNISVTNHPGFKDFHPSAYHPALLAVLYGYRATFHRISTRKDYDTHLGERQSNSGNDRGLVDTQTISELPYPIPDLKHNVSEHNYATELHNFVVRRYAQMHMPSTSRDEL